MISSRAPRVIVSLWVCAVLPAAVAFGGQEADGCPAPYLMNPDVKLVVKTYALNPYQPKLDGQWEGSIVASDGKVYFASSTHAHDTAGMFFKYDPAAKQISVLSQSMSVTCGENPLTQVPQGKIHSPVVESNGWLYFATHLANYWTDATNRFTGSHALGYNLATGQFRDYGVIRSRFTCYDAVSVDPVRNCMYTFVTPWASADFSQGSHVYRINLTSGAKTDLGAVGTQQNANFAQFVDKWGNMWFNVNSNPGTLYVVRGDTGQIQSFANCLPTDLNLHTATPASNQNGRWFTWGKPTGDGEHFLFTMNGGGLYEFDAGKMLDNNPSDAFRMVQFIGINSMAKCLGGRDVYYLQSPNLTWNNAAKASDHHLMGVDIDTGLITDFGRVVDELGRTPWRAEGMSADANGHVYMTGDWRLLKDANGNLLESGTVRHNDSNPGTYWTADMWRGQFFAVANVPEPATCLFLAAGAAMLLRRRQAA